MIPCEISGLVETQEVLNRKHLGWAALKDTFVLAAKLAAQGQTNFLRMLWKFSSVYNVDRQVRDHRRAVKYEMSLPDHAQPGRLNPESLYIHPQQLLQPLRAASGNRR